MSANQNDLPPWLRDDFEEVIPSSQPASTFKPKPLPPRQSPAANAQPPWLVEAAPEEQEDPNVPDWVRRASQDAPAETFDADLTYDEWQAQQVEKNRPRSIEEEVPDLTWSGEDNASAPKTGREAARKPSGTGPLSGEVPNWYLGLEQLDTSDAPDWFTAASPSSSVFVSPFVEEEAPEPPPPPTPPSAPPTPTRSTGVQFAPAAPTDAIDQFFSSLQSTPVYNEEPAYDDDADAYGVSSIGSDEEWIAEEPPASYAVDDSYTGTQMDSFFQSLSKSGTPPSANSGSTASSGAARMSAPPPPVPTPPAPSFGVDDEDEIPDFNLLVGSTPPQPAPPAAPPARAQTVDTGAEDFAWFALNQPAPSTPPPNSRSFDDIEEPDLSMFGATPAPQRTPAMPSADDLLTMFPEDEEPEETIPAESYDSGTMAWLSEIQGMVASANRSDDDLPTSMDDADFIAAASSVQSGQVAGRGDEFDWDPFTTSSAAAASPARQPAIENSLKPNSQNDDFFNPKPSTSELAANDAPDWLSALGDAQASGTGTLKPASDSSSKLQRGSGLLGGSKRATGSAASIKPESPSASTSSFPVPASLSTSLAAPVPPTTPPPSLLTGMLRRSQQAEAPPPSPSPPPKPVFVEPDPPPAPPVPSAPSEEDPFALGGMRFEDLYQTPAASAPASEPVADEDEFLVPDLSTEFFVNQRAIPEQSSPLAWLDPTLLNTDELNEPPASSEALPLDIGSGANAQAAADEQFDVDDLLASWKGTGGLQDSPPFTTMKTVNQPEAIDELPDVTWTSAAASAEPQSDTGGLSALYFSDEPTADDDVVDDVDDSGGVAEYEDTLDDSAYTGASFGDNAYDPPSSSMAGGFNADELPTMIEPVDSLSAFEATPAERYGSVNAEAASDEDEYAWMANVFDNPAASPEVPANDDASLYGQGSEATFAQEMGLYDADEAEISAYNAGVSDSNTGAAAIYSFNTTNMPDDEAAEAAEEENVIAIKPSDTDWLQMLRGAEAEARYRQNEAAEAASVSEADEGASEMGWLSDSLFAAAEDTDGTQRASMSYATDEDDDWSALRQPQWDAPDDLMAEDVANSTRDAARLDDDETPDEGLEADWEENQAATFAQGWTSSNATSIPDMDNVVAMLGLGLDDGTYAPNAQTSAAEDPDWLVEAPENEGGWEWFSSPSALLDHDDDLIDDEMLTLVSARITSQPAASTAQDVPSDDADPLPETGELTEYWDDEESDSDEADGWDTYFRNNGEQ